MSPMALTESILEIVVGTPFLLTALAVFAALIYWLRRGGQPSVNETVKGLQEKVLKEYTPVEVAQHNSQGDVWIIVKGKVYDVTPYVEEHPGGLAILKNAGGDATEGFHGPQHPPRVFDIIDDFLIGKLAGA